MAANVVNSSPTAKALLKISHLCFITAEKGNPSVGFHITDHFGIPGVGFHVVDLLTSVT